MSKKSNVTYLRTDGVLNKYHDQHVNFAYYVKDIIVDTVGFYNPVYTSLISTSHIGLPAQTTLKD
jgi:hypothetical protein